MSQLSTILLDLPGVGGGDLVEVSPSASTSSTGTSHYELLSPATIVASPYHLAPPTVESLLLVSALAMDEPLPELPVAPPPPPHHQQNPRRRLERKFAPLAIAPTRSLERKQQDARLDGAKSGIERPRTKEPSFTSNAMGIQAPANRGHQFTVGNISNGLIYLRYHPTLHLRISLFAGCVFCACQPEGRKPAFILVIGGFLVWAFLKQKDE